METAAKKALASSSDAGIAKVKEQAQSESSRASREINSEQLVNKLNYANFQNSTILVYFKHSAYGRSIFFHAMPDPCMDDRVECVWVDPPQSLQTFDSYDFQHFLLIDHQQTFLVEPEVIEITEAGISFRLPDSGREVGSRAVERHACEDVSVQLIQNSALFHGRLIDFSAAAFRVNLEATRSQRFQWINPDLPVNIIVSRDREALYTGECRIIRQLHGGSSGMYVLQPVTEEISRFKAKTERSLRQEVTPSPNMISRHPLTRQMLNLRVVDLSGSGFSVIEDRSRAALLPGMIIPEMELRFADGFRAKCKVQVIYRRQGADETRNEALKCGLAFLDMDIQDHKRLVGLLHQLKDRKSYISNAVDLNKLWSFFFDANFIYPEKYAHIQKNKEKIQAIYEKLYTENPSIARHFIYQDKGEILGHMAMLRFYENAWLIHHYAASRTRSNWAGLMVLDQVSRFSNDSHSLYSMHMDYLMCYLGSDKSPNRIFGGAARNIGDPEVCSLDPFAYFHHSQSDPRSGPLAETWSLEKTSPEDLLELESYYGTESGGLMMQSHDLSPGMGEASDLAGEYQDLGLVKEKHLFSLKRAGRLKAVFLANISDIGLNLSELTNTITTMILDQDRFPPDILYAALTRIMRELNQASMPVLLFPTDYANDHSLSYERIYNLWILNTQYGDQYFNYINKLLRFIRE